MLGLPSLLCNSQLLKLQVTTPSYINSRSPKKLAREKGVWTQSDQNLVKTQLHSDQTLIQKSTAVWALGVSVGAHLCCPVCLHCSFILNMGFPLYTVRCQKLTGQNLWAETPCPDSKALSVGSCRVLATWTKVLLFQKHSGLRTQRLPTFPYSHSSDGKNHISLYLYL